MDVPYCTDLEYRVRGTEYGDVELEIGAVK
jgi:hypothetical protein